MEIIRLSRFSHRNFNFKEVNDANDFDTTNRVESLSGNKFYTYTQMSVIDLKNLFARGFARLVTSSTSICAREVKDKN